MCSMGASLRQELSTALVAVTVTCPEYAQSITPVDG
jgi:hypothetical protein